MHRLDGSVNLGRLADTLADQDYIVIDDFLNLEETDDLIALVSLHLNEKNFSAAGIGKGDEYEVDRSVRGDLIKWLDPATALPSAGHLLGRIEKLMKQLNRLLFLSMVDFECHLAVYPPGSYYEKHFDHFKNRNFRKLSFVIYLNKNWLPNEGGELILHRPEEDVSIFPFAGRMVLFRSDCVEHEVKVTERQRFSITGWMLDRPVDWPLA